MFEKILDISKDELRSAELVADLMLKELLDNGNLPEYVNLGARILKKTSRIAMLMSEDFVKIFISSKDELKVKTGEMSENDLIKKRTEALEFLDSLEADIKTKLKEFRKKKYIAPTVNIRFENTKDILFSEDTDGIIIIKGKSHEI